MEKEYKCICGKIFNNPQSFNGHKGHCKQHQLNKHGNLDIYNKNKANMLNNCIQGRKTQLEKHKVNKVLKLEKWIEEKHACEKCGKVMTEYYGSGRFCSSECARSFSTIKNREEINKKVSNTLKGTKYYSNGEATIGIKPNEKVPEGYIKGNFSISKLSFNEFKNKKSLEGTHIKCRKIKKSSALTINQRHIQEHNLTVLKQYEKLLYNKSKNKHFYIDDNDVCLYGQYKAIIKNNHPRSRAGRVFIHVLMAEKLLDRYLTEKEVVHHKNEDKLDNRFDNIYIFKSKSDHARFHYAKYYWLKIENDVLVCEKIDLSKLNNTIQ